MKPLPFKMRQETEMEKFRHDSFWTKEPETLAWIESFNPTDVFFDVGANVGVYSLYAASLYPEMRILAFEPLPANHLSLKYNKEINGFNKICCLPWAVGNICGLVDFDTVNDAAGSTGGQINSASRAYKKLSTFCARIDDIGYPDYVKIDIDGQELAVIQGMKKTLPYIKSILVEVSKVSKQPIMDILTAAGFTTDNRFNKMSPHSRERREREGIDAENIIFTR